MLGGQRFFLFFAAAPPASAATAAAAGTPAETPPVCGMPGSVVSSNELPAK
jgi:hypothetical protein